MKTTLTSTLTSSVGTQTEAGQFENEYAELYSTLSMTSLNLYDFDSEYETRDDDYDVVPEMAQLNCIGQRRMMASQTDLSLSHFDLCNNFDSDIDDEFEDDHPASEEDGMIPLEQCNQFFQLLRNSCGAQVAESKHNDSRAMSNNHRSPLQHPKDQRPLVCSLQLDRSAKQTDKKTEDNGNKPTRRVVPRMGTKIDFSKQNGNPGNGQPCTASGQAFPPWMRPVEAFTPGYNFPDYKRTTCAVSPPLPNGLIHQDEGIYANISDTRSNSPTDLSSHLSRCHFNSSYHSDSENSTSLGSLSLQQKEWNSDGDAKAATASPSSDDSSERSSESFSDEKTGARKLESLRRELYKQYADVMYTNRANLQHTIMVQQRLFQQQLLANKNNQCFAPNFDSSNFSNPWNFGTPDANDNSRLEWVIKKRGDGSRYITRRPARSEMFKHKPVNPAATPGAPVTPVTPGTPGSPVAREQVKLRASNTGHSRQDRKPSGERHQRSQLQSSKPIAAVSPHAAEKAPRSGAKITRRKQNPEDSSARQELVVGKPTPVGKSAPNHKNPHNNNPLLSVTTI